MLGRSFNIFLCVALGLFVRKIYLLVMLLLVVSCTGVPPGVTPVQQFSLPNYLGTWYEIARLDHSFERGLTEVTANYSLRDDGGVRVLNRGYDAEEGAWHDAEGKACFVDEPTVGRLKVSFFGPFYGAYNIARLSPDYSMALVVGPDLSYGWILARSPNPSAEMLKSFQQTATELGISLDSWIMVAHGNNTKGN